MIINIQIGITIDHNNDSFGPQISWRMRDVIMMADETTVFYHLKTQRPGSRRTSYQECPE